MATYPYEVGFPVKFYSGGDTTKEAFNKHIQEIERIYGILNALNADKLSASEFTTKLNAHINDSNPHPNLDLGNTKGSIPFSRVSGDLDLSRTTGNLNGSRITGTLSSSVIPTLSTSKISGLADYIKSQSSGITNGNVSEDGYVKFGNNLIFQWGRCLTGDTVSFPITFPNAVFIVNVCEAFPEETTGNGMYCTADKFTKAGFECKGVQPYNEGRLWKSGFTACWFAIGN